MHAGLVVDSLGRARDSQVRGRPIGRRITRFSNHCYYCRCRFLLFLVDVVVRWFYPTDVFRRPWPESWFRAR